MATHQKHLQVKIIEGVYPPGEDTWFLSDILVDYVQENFGSMKNQIVCEIGVGSGYISILLSLKFPELTLIGTDISPLAMSLCYENSLRLAPRGKFLFYCSNLLNCFNASMLKVDIIFFNPPYVRTPLQEVTDPKPPIARTWAGGPDGVKFINQFLKELINFQFKNAFFLSSSLNNNNIFLEVYASQLKIVEVGRKKIEDEKLICYKVCKS
jgi:methylase of polypeptide subunit release factors